MTKATALRACEVSIRAVRNGYLVKVKDAERAFPYSFTLTCADGSQQVKRPAKTAPAPQGQYIFPDFASLTAWLRKNITHGNGVEA